MESLPNSEYKDATRFVLEFAPPARRRDEPARLLHARTRCEPSFSGPELDLGNLSPESLLWDARSSPAFPPHRNHVVRRAQLRVLLPCVHPSYFPPWIELISCNFPIEPRHSCEQGDELASYGYTEHDGRNSAVQVIKDTKNNVEITTELLKVPGGDSGSGSLDSYFALLDD